MKEKTKEKKRPVVKATTAKETSPAYNYVEPNIFRVNSKVEPDNPSFTPVNQEGGKYCDVFLNTVSRSTNQVILNHRASETLDFGCKITIPAGYKINGNVVSRLACLGLVCCSVYLDQDKRLKFVVVNAGKQTPIILLEKELVGRIWIEPTYYFDWNNYE